MVAHLSLDVVSPELVSASGEEAKGGVESP